MNKPHYSEKDRATIAAYYGRVPISELAKMLESKRSTASIYNHANRRNILKPQEVLKTPMLVLAAMRKEYKQKAIAKRKTQA